jgi:uncharacterized membrane protein
MGNVDSVTQRTDTLTHWKISIAGVSREFDAEITEQQPDERIAWKSTGGVDHAGVVTFHKLDPTTTRVTLQINTDPEGFVENVADKAGLTNLGAKGDLERFKKFIEGRGRESGAWRGEVPRS